MTFWMLELFATSSICKVGSKFVERSNCKSLFDVAGNVVLIRWNTISMFLIDFRMRSPSEKLPQIHSTPSRVSRKISFAPGTFSAKERTNAPFATSARHKLTPIKPLPPITRQCNPLRLSVMYSLFDPYQLLALESFSSLHIYK